MSEEAHNQEPEVVNDAITTDDQYDFGNQKNVDEESNVESIESKENSSENEKEVSKESDEGVQAETEDELKDEIAEAVENGASEQEVKNMIKEFTIKVNGKEKNVKLDLSDEEQIRKKLQLAEAGQLSMQKARELEKAYEKGLKELQQDPWKVLKDLGLDPDNLAEQRLRERVEELKKSPEQREKERMQQELEEARNELKRQKEEAERAKFEQLQAQEAEKLEEEIIDALDSHTTLPKSRKTVMRIADAMLWAMENGYDVSANDVIPAVEKEIQNEISVLFDSMPEDLMEQYIGKKHMERLRQKRLSSMKTNNAKNIKPTAKSLETQENDNKKTKKMKISDYFDKLGQ